MQLKNILAAGIIGLTALGAAAPAQAGSNVSIGIEFGGGRHFDRGHDRQLVRYDVLSPRQVRSILRREGFREIRYLDRSGSIYRAHAENRRGRDVIVTVSAHSGEILDVHRLRRR